MLFVSFQTLSNNYDMLQMAKSGFIAVRHGNMSDKARNVIATQKYGGVVFVML